MSLSMQLFWIVRKNRRKAYLLEGQPLIKNLEITGFISMDCQLPQAAAGMRKLQRQLHHEKLRIQRGNQL